MRQLSVGAVKRSLSNTKKSGGRMQTEPKPGTKLRKLYDWLKASPGDDLIASTAPVESPVRGKMLNVLRIFYGLDIATRQEGRFGRKGGSYSIYTLVGEYLPGGGYISYKK